VGARAGLPPVRAPSDGRRARRWAATVARHARPGIDPAKVGQTSGWLAWLARSPRGIAIARC